MSTFAPVFLPPDRVWDGSLSMTFGRHYNRCPRSAFLYRKHGASPVQSVEMVRGSAVHAILERATNAVLEAGERRIPPELCKAIANEVLAEFPVPYEEHDYVRELAYRWASQWVLRADERVVSVERLFVLELEGWRVRCRVDFASMDDRKALYVADYKSGRGAPSYDDVTRKRPDGSLAAKAFQLVVYGLAIAFGQPVEIVPCPACEGNGVVMLVSEPDENGQRDGDEVECRECHGSGRVEVVGEQVARGCPEAIMEFVFPGIESGDGLMLKRTMGMTRLEMLEARESLATMLARVTRSVTTGDWPAVASDAACDECPAIRECPIPRELRDYQGQINTDEELKVALARRHVAQKMDRALGREIRGYVKKLALPVRYGQRVAEIVTVDSVETRDREGLWAALAEGMSPGEAREKFEKRSTGTRFTERDLKPDEYTNKEE